MKVHTTRIQIHTYDGVSMQDVAPELRNYVHRSAVDSGLCVISTPHSDCAVTICDEVDERYSDLLQATRRLAHVPMPSGHGPEDRVDEVTIGATLAAFPAHSLTLPIRGGTLAIGSWEAVLLLESQRPASRQLDVTILGD